MKQTSIDKGIPRPKIVRGAIVEYVSVRNTYVGVMFRRSSDAPFVTRPAVFDKTAETTALKSGDVIDIEKRFDATSDQLICRKSISNQTNFNI